MTVAITAIESGKYSIERVATLVGYGNRRSLERAIKSATDTTPAALQRRRIRSPEDSAARRITHAANAIILTACNPQAYRPSAEED